MRRVPALMLTALLAAASGCNLYQLAIHNVSNEFLQSHDNLSLLRDLRALGEEVWCEMVRLQPDAAYSEDYHQGFVEGFADYLDAGGNGTPPAAPPNYYRRNRYFTPEGDAAVRDWFAGFRHGAAVAMASGKRRQVIVEISAPPATPSVDSVGGRVRRPAGQSGETPEEAPRPRPAEPEPPAPAARKTPAEPPAEPRPEPAPNQP